MGSVSEENYYFLFQSDWFSGYFHFNLFSFLDWIETKNILEEIFIKVIEQRFNTEKLLLHLNQQLLKEKPKYLKRWC